MEAIRVEYKGIGFRSKTEAKWALLLDRLGIVYEYEKQNFEFCSGEWYLPDFYLCDMSVFLEIKGESLSDLAVRKMARLVYCVGLSGIILLGDPLEFMAFAFKSKVTRSGLSYVLLSRLEDSSFVKDVLCRSELEFINRASEEAMFGSGGNRSGNVEHHDYTEKSLEKVGVEWQLDTRGYSITPAVIEHISLDLPFNKQKYRLQNEREI